MKKFFALLALALFIPAMASAQIKWNGQFNVFGYSFDNRAFADNGTSNTYARLILGANFDLTDTVEGNIALSYFNVWGDSYLAGQQTDNSSDTGVLNSIRVTEANVIFKNLFDNDRLSVKVGRQNYDGGSLFYVGPRDFVWSYYLLADGAPYYIVGEGGMDGAVVTYDDKEKLTVDVGYSKIANEYNTLLSAKINTTFVNAKYTLNDMWKFQGYVYDSEMYSGSSARLEHIGVKPEFRYNSIFASAEFAQCFISDKGDMFSMSDTNDGYMAKLNASYDMAPFKFRGMYLMTGTDFYMTGLQNNYVGLIFTSMSKMFVYTPFPSDIYVDCVNVGADYTIGKFDFAVDYFRLGLPRSASTKLYELDLTAKYNYNKDITFKGAIGHMGVENKGNMDTTIYFLGLDYKFGSK